MVCKNIRLKLQLALVNLTKYNATKNEEHKIFKQNGFLSIDIDLKAIFKHALCRNLTVLFWKNMI